MTDQNETPRSIEERLAKIDTLYNGAHDAPRNGHVVACAMEAVAYIAGEPWSDHPECACPVIASFMRSWNDSLPDEERTALLMPLVPKLVGTRGSKALEERRSLMAADWLVRTHTPAWLRLAGLNEQADLLANLPEITSLSQVPSIRGPLEAVRKDAAAARVAAVVAAVAAAGDAAVAAAWAAARDAARDAARAAAGDAAGDAAGAAAVVAAVAAAGDAAVAAAWDAATEHLAATKRELQQSAVALVERMIAAEEV